MHRHKRPNQQTIHPPTTHQTPPNHQSQLTSFPNSPTSPIYTTHWGSYTLLQMGSFLAMEEDSNTSSNVTTGKDTKEETGKDSKVEFSEDEETLIARMFSLVGERWNLIAGRIPGRSAEEIKNYWTSKSISSSTKQYD